MRRTVRTWPVSSPSATGAVYDVAHICARSPVFPVSPTVSRLYRGACPAGGVRVHGTQCTYTYISIARARRTPRVGLSRGSSLETRGCAVKSGTRRSTAVVPWAFLYGLHPDARGELEELRGPPRDGHVKEAWVQQRR